MTRIVFVRHGESELNVLQNTPLRRFNGSFDTPLTVKGRQQALRTGLLLRERTDLKIQSVITSTASRAIDTAKIAITQLPYKAELLPPNPLWNERSLGEFENRLASDVFAELPKYHVDPNFNQFTMHYTQKAPGGENFTEVTERVWPALEELEERFDGDVAVFTHAHLLRCVLGKMFGLSKTQSIAMHIPNAHPVIVAREGDEYVLEGALQIDLWPHPQR